MPKTLQEKKSITLMHSLKSNQEKLERIKRKKKTKFIQTLSKKHK